MKQSMKLAARILENLPVMSSDVMHGRIDNPKASKEFLAALAPSAEKQVTVGTDTTHLRFLESSTIHTTSGIATLAEASDVFTGYLDAGYKKWGTDIAGVDTEATPVDIYEMKKDGTLADIFGSFGFDLRSLCLTQGQVKEFARSHRHLLRQGGGAAMFLFEANGELFVADVYLRGGKLKAFVNRFSYGYVWSACHRYRVVVPQQTV
jgi:hypothetical protein